LLLVPLLLVPQTPAMVGLATPSWIEVPQTMATKANCWLDCFR
jgi:hypothetical protein